MSFKNCKKNIVGICQIYAQQKLCCICKKNEIDYFCHYKYCESCCVSQEKNCQHYTNTFTENQNSDEVIQNVYDCTLMNKDVSGIIVSYISNYCKFCKNGNLSSCDFCFDYLCKICDKSYDVYSQYESDTDDYITKQACYACYICTNQYELLNY